MAERARGWLIWTLLAVLAVLLGAALAIAGILGTRSGRLWAADLALAQASTPDLMIEVFGLDWPTLDRISLDSLTLSDSGGRFLEIGALTAEWRPAALLSGLVAVERIEVARVAVLQLPQTPPEAAATDASSDPLALPDLPVSFRLGALDVGAIEIAPAVAGQAVTLSGKVTLRWPENGALALQANLHDVRDGRAALTADIAVDRESQVSATVRIDDAAGGVIAALLAVPDWPRTQVDIAGVGPLTDWRGQVQASVGDLAAAGGPVTANLLDLDRIDAALTGRLGGGLPALFGIADIPDLNFAATAELLDLDRAVLKQLVVTAPESRLEAAGTVHADGRIDRLHVMAHAKSADWQALLPPELAFADIAARVDITGTIALPEAEGRLTLERLQGPGGLALRRFDCAVSVEPEAPAWSVSGDCRLEGASGDPLLGQALGDAATLRVAGAVAPESGRVDIDSLALAGNRLSLNGKANLQLPEGDAVLPTTEFDVALTLADVAPFASAFSVPASGPLKATARGSSDAAGALSGHVAVEAAPRWAAELGVPEAVQGPVTLSTGFGVSRELALEITQGRFGIGQVRGRFDGRAQLPDGAVAAEASIVLADSQRLTLPIDGLAEGPSSLSLTASGSLAELRIDGHVSVADIVLPEATLAEPRAGFALRLTGADLVGSARLELTAAGQPVSAEGAFALREQDSLAVTGLDLRAPGIAATGAVSGRLSTNLWQGRVRADAPDLSELAAVLGQPIGGSFSASIDLSAPDGRQSADIAATASRLSWMREGAPVLVDGLELSATGQDLFGAGSVAAKATIDGLVTPEATVSAASFDLRGGLQAMDWTLRLTGERQAPLSLAMTGTAALRGQEAEVIVASLDGALAKAPLHLIGPLTLRHGPDGQRLSGLALAIGEGRIEGQVDLSPTTLEADLDVTSLPLAPFASFAAGTAVEGQLGARATLRWTASRQAFDLQAEGQGLRLIDEAQNWPPIALAMQSEWRGQALTVQGTVSGILEEPGRFEASVPLIAGPMPPEVALRPDGPLSARLRWRGEIGPLLTLLPLSEHRLNGQGNLDLAVEGTPDAPRLAGVAELSDGSYRHLYWGTSFEGIELAAKGDSAGSLTLTGNASDGGGGTLALSGAVSLNEPGEPSGWLTVKLDAVRAMARDELTGQVSADVRLEGDLKETLLSGTATVDRMEVRIPDRLPPSVVDLSVEEVGRPDRAPPPDPDAGADSGPLTRLDLVVEIPGQVFVRGRGLDSEWGGQLTIGGTSRAPEISGTLTAIRGRFDFAGRSFAISSGSLRFRGGDEVDPEIEVVIEHSRADLQAKIVLSGPVSAPALELSSVPSLPDDEILARIIFGKSARELSPLQSLQLAKSVAEVSGAVSGGGIMDTLRETLGVDALTVDDDGDGTKVGVGKYLFENVYVGVRQGAKAGSGELAAEVELTPGISLDSEIGQDARGNIGLNWHHDY